MVFGIEVLEADHAGLVVFFMGAVFAFEAECWLSGFDCVRCNSSLVCNEVLFLLWRVFEQRASVPGEVFGRYRHHNAVRRHLVGVTEDVVCDVGLRKLVKYIRRWVANCKRQALLVAANASSAARVVTADGGEPCKLLHSCRESCAEYGAAALRPRGALLRPRWIDVYTLRGLNLYIGKQSTKI